MRTCTQVMHLATPEPMSPTDEPVYRGTGRRGTVFAEAYNPEEDDEDDVKVVTCTFLCNMDRWFIQRVMSSEPGCRRGLSPSSSSACWNKTSCQRWPPFPHTV